MIHTDRLIRRTTQLFVFISLSFCAVIFANEDLIQPKNIVVDQSLDQKQAEAMSLAARRYYTFWHTGDSKFAAFALDAGFIDLNLPAGRPQGPSGPVLVSAQFRSAVPDLQLEVEEMMIVGDRVIGRLHFAGHFTGSFEDRKGQGQKIEFSAVDLYRIKDEKIVENWHVEDNLSLMRQLGSLEKAP